ncbi:MAG: hypothetical protein H0X50_10030, partial [Nitrosopumilus sp.]|nr:hypothetical protein [Nitrosopumilus sp.]
MNKSITIITSIVITFALFFASTNVAAQVFAQNQSSPQQAGQQQQQQNQTSAALTGQAQTAIANQTTIPAQQTSVTVNQTQGPADNQTQLMPLENQTLQQQLPDISNLENKTMVQPTGPAITTIVNQTTVPFNQTTIELGNSTTSPQQAGQQQQQNQTGQQAGQQQQQNQT